MVNEVFYFVFILFSILYAVFVGETHIAARKCDDRDCKFAHGEDELRVHDSVSSTCLACLMRSN